MTVKASWQTTDEIRFTEKNVGQTKRQRVRPARSQKGEKNNAKKR